ncbi:hypothetical protein PVAND_016652 [Polypedilum vanderplanki]|uniref:Uncharacterized protein n=1 Tax=Polypedilum vanderplanki TaxID=319348 RepID=A0A9J6BG19_POLVA|nr:hypothetical protein PVAND_016652 [Polypedilum vanderplanki]
MKIFLAVFGLFLAFYIKEISTGGSSISSETVTSFSSWISSSSSNEITSSSTEKNSSSSSEFSSLSSSEEISLSSSEFITLSSSLSSETNPCNPSQKYKGKRIKKGSIGSLYNKFQKAYTKYSIDKPVINETIKTDLIQAVILVNNETVTNASNPTIVLNEIRMFVSYLFSFTENAENYELDTEDATINCKNVQDKIQIAHDIAELTAIEGEDFNATIDALSHFIDQLSNGTYDEYVENLKIVLGRILESASALSAENDKVLWSVDDLLTRLEMFKDKKCSITSSTPFSTIVESTQIPLSISSSFNLNS